MLAVRRTSCRTSRRSAAALALATLLPLLLIRAEPLAAQRSGLAATGLAYTMRVTTSATGPLAAMPAVGSGRVLTAGTNMRYEYADTGMAPLLHTGTVMLMLDRGARVVVLDPARREYVAFEPAALVRQASEAMQAAGNTTRLVDPDVRLEHVGTGERMLGEPTDHWRMTQRMTLVSTVGGSESAIETEVTSDLWLGATPFDAPAGRADGPEAMLSMLASPEFTERVAAARRQLPPLLPLRTEMTLVMRSGGQEMARSVMTMEVTSVSHVPVPADAFVIPAGYREVPFPTAPAAPASRP